MSQHPRKVKVFCDSHTASMEIQVNQWLADQNIEIIKFHSDVNRGYHYITIFYWDLAVRNER